MRCRHWLHRNEARVIKKRSEEAGIKAENNRVTGEKYSVFGYIAALFAFTLLLLLLSWFIQQRNESCNLLKTETENMKYQVETNIFI